MVAFNYSRQFATAPILRYPGGKAEKVGFLRHYRPEARENFASHLSVAAVSFLRSVLLASGHG